MVRGWPTDAAGDPMDPPDARTEDPAATAGRTGTGAAVRATLARIRRDRAAALVARGMDGRSLADIAGELGVSVSRAHQLAAQGKRDFFTLWRIDS